MVSGVLVTGGGSGIGAAVAVELAQRGCDVVVAGRRAAALDQVARASSRITACEGDVTDPDARAALSAALSQLPEPRALFHAAGYFQTGMLDRLSIDDWRRSFETNVTARWALSTDCAPLLGGGRILFIGSDAGANPRAGAAAYSIAQAASETLRRGLQAEWSDRRIAVGGFKPGLVDTDMVRGFLQLSPDELPARAVYDQYVNRGEIASARLVARFATWLLLDVATRRFTSTEWDIRDTDHHDEWTDEPLYPDAG